MVQWKEFGSRSEYRVSNTGIIQTRLSSGRYSATQALGEWRDKKLTFRVSDYTGAGYLATGLRLEGNRFKTHYVHRIVTQFFIGNIPKGMQVNHIDGNRFNNSADNLEIVSPLENMQNAVDRGALSGYRRNMAKMSLEEFRDIRRLLKEGYKHIQIAELYRINRKLVSKIARLEGVYSLYPM